MIGACSAIGQQRLEAEPAHALDQDAAVLAYARRGPRRRPRPRCSLERLIEGGEHVGRRREAPLAVLSMLATVMRSSDRAGALPAAAVRASSADDARSRRRARPRGTCWTRRRRRRTAIFAGIERQGAEGAHGVDQQPAAVARDNLGDPLDGFRMPEVVSQWTAATWRDRRVFGQRARRARTGSFG